MSGMRITYTPPPRITINPGGARGPEGPPPTDEQVAEVVADYLADNPVEAGPHTHPISEVDDLQAELDEKAPLDSPAFTGTPTGITKAHIGLGSVDNTADADKPVSTATQTALDDKSDVGHTHPQSDVTGLSGALAGKSDTGHTHTSGSVTDFVEAVHDAVAALLAEGANVSMVYDDEGNTLTVSATGGGGGDAEMIRDTIGAAVVGLGNISVLIDDEADTITIVTTATQNSTDAALRDRSTHTGTQDAATTITGLATVAISGAYGDLSGKPSLGTAAALNVPVSGNAASGEVVKGNDSRLSDARTPTTHSHAVGDLPVASSGESSSTKVVRADDSRLSDSRTPTTHSHTASEVTNFASAVAALKRLVRHSNDGTYDYMGTAPAGTAEGSSGWTVKRITIASPPVPMTGTGTWTGRAAISYS